MFQHVKILIKLNLTARAGLTCVAAPPPSPSSPPLGRPFYITVWFFHVSARMKVQHASKKKHIPLFKPFHWFCPAPPALVWLWSRVLRGEWEQLSTSSLLAVTSPATHPRRQLHPAKSTYISFIQRVIAHLLYKLHCLKLNEQNTISTAEWPGH